MTINRKRIIGISTALCAMLGGVISSIFHNTEAMAYCYATSTLVLILTGDFMIVHKSSGNIEYTVETYCTLCDGPCRDESPYVDDAHANSCSCSKCTDAPHFNFLVQPDNVPVAKHPTVPDCSEFVDDHVDADKAICECSECVDGHA